LEKALKEVEKEGMKARGGIEDGVQAMHG